MEEWGWWCWHAVALVVIMQNSFTIYPFVCAYTNHCPQSLHSTQYALGSTMWWHTCSCQFVWVVRWKVMIWNPCLQTINHTNCLLLFSDWVWEVWWHHVHSQLSGLAECCHTLTLFPIHSTIGKAQWLSGRNPSEGFVCQMNILMTLHQFISQTMNQYSQHSSKWQWFLDSFAVCS